MDYPEAVAWIFGFTNYELTPLPAAPAGALRLERIRSLLARLDDPQRAARSIHITGSKGKGSTAAMVAALLTHGGARTGLYTSPHLHSPCERIAVDGVPVSEDEFARLATLLRPHAEAQNEVRHGDCVTTFELLTVLAFLAFREHGCAWQAVEVGMGGTLDATNVLDQKDLCIFTPISLEHTAVLGPTTAAIARDKAGILRRGCRAVLAPQDEAAGAVLRGACAALDVPYKSVELDCRWSADSAGLDGQDCRIRTSRAEYRFRLALLGGHQVENAATALLGLEQLARAGVELPPEQVAVALAGVRWPGRLEVLAREPLILVDGAHNAASAQRLAEALRGLLSVSTPVAKNRAPTPGNRRLILVVGTLTDKDLAGIAAALAPVAAEVIVVEPNQPRARPAADVAAAFAAVGASVREAPGVAAGIEAALNLAGPDGAVCVAGSLYVAAEARATVLGGTAAQPLRTGSSPSR